MREQRIALTFGPVQEFLAQARRTRDLWIGSYLLSYLAGSAFLAARAAGGTLVLPDLTGNPLADALERGGVPAMPGDRVGSVPHVAEIAVADADPSAVARAAVRGWTDAWDRLSDEVRSAWRERLPAWTAETDAIWERQCRSLWWHAWTIDDPDGLARRKSLRNFDQPAEPGEKCTCCGSREPLHAAAPNRHDVRAFWADAAQRLPAGEVQPDGQERLCAICTLKRLLPRSAPRAFGWGVPTAFASTTALATLDWRRAVLEHGAVDACLRRAVIEHVTAARHLESHSAGLSGFAPLETLADGWAGEEQAARQFLALDGDCLFPDELRRIAAKPGGQQVAAAVQTLRLLYDTARSAGIGLPGTAYVLLAMDGDHLGGLLRRYSDQKSVISTAMGDFSHRVATIVEGRQGHGRLIYAGGDDVLALLPASSALATALALRQEYQQALSSLGAAGTVPGEQPTISAGLVFAHMRTPLRSVVASAHEVLDTLAKERACRDAYAVRVRKSAGTTIEFAVKWDELQPEKLDELTGYVRDDTISTGFLYGLTALLDGIENLPEGAKRAIIASQLAKNRQTPSVEVEGQHEHVADLLLQLVRKRPVGGPTDALRFAADRARGEA